MGVSLPTLLLRSPFHLIPLLVSQEPPSESLEKQQMVLSLGRAGSFSSIFSDAFPPQNTLLKVSQGSSGTRALVPACPGSGDGKMLSAE